MKKVVLFSFILMQNFCFAQTSVVGIGRFKIGKTNISIIDSISKELKTKVTITDGIPYVYNQEPNKVYELKRNSTNPYSSDINSTECEGFRVFYISTYNILDILIERFYLTFKDNVLYRIRAKSEELYDALKIKYPEYEISKEEETTNCVEGGLRDARFAKETTYTTTWSNDSIQAEIIHRFYYRRDCEAASYDYLEISKLPYIYLNNCDKAIQENRKNMEKNERLKKLKDL